MILRLVNLNNLIVPIHMHIVIISESIQFFSENHQPKQKVKPTINPITSITLILYSEKHRHKFIISKKLNFDFVEEFCTAESYGNSSINPTKSNKNKIHNI